MPEVRERESADRPLRALPGAVGHDLRFLLPRSHVRLRGTQDVRAQVEPPRHARRAVERTGVELTLQIKAPHFTAGVVVDVGVVVGAAPIVKYMLGWTEDRVRGYCEWKKWEIS